MLSEVREEMVAVIADVLSDGRARTLEQVLAELRAEYPESVETASCEYASAYGYSGCGQLMAPVNAVADALACLEGRGEAVSFFRDGLKLWQNAS
ncbi:MAG: hypothetical protein D9V47_05260 [Clostridia bacterium]|nr:MAG: hypothetical protein D9V47_05260 [Clostridia bacterium]